MGLTGKGFFVWKVQACENGNVTEIAALAKAANLTHVLVKIANGTLPYNYDSSSNTDYAGMLVQALHAQGIQAWGWHYVYGSSPQAEASIAIQRIKELGVDGYVIDAESEYKKPGRRAAATQFMAQLRASLPNYPIALCSYRYPSYHPELPWREFLERCDLNMPQVYWMQAHNAGEQLTQSVRQFQAMTPYRPIIPVGAAFREYGWQPKATEVQEFLTTSKSLNLNAGNFWEWSDARSGNLPNVWETIRDFNWSGQPIPQDICQRYIHALNTHDANQVASLYNSNAIHITSAHSIQGIDAICGWYKQFFTQLLPDATFTLTNYTSADTSRHFNWTAASNQGKILNGNDTFGLVNEKITYHYSFYTITP